MVLANPRFPIGVKSVLLPVGHQPSTINHRPSTTHHPPFIIRRSASTTWALGQPRNGTAAIYSTRHARLCTGAGLQERSGGAEVEEVTWVLRRQDVGTDLTLGKYLH